MMSVFVGQAVETNAAGTALPPAAAGPVSVGVAVEQNTAPAVTAVVAGSGGGGESAPDPLFNNVTLLLPLDGSDGSTAIVDESTLNNTVTVNGALALTTAEFKFGGASLRMPTNASATNQLSVPNSPTLLDVAGDFSIQFWFKRDPSFSGGSLTYLLSDFQDGGAYAIDIQHRGFTSGSVIRAELFSSAGSLISRVDTGGVIVDGPWYYVEITRSEDTLYAFIDGVLLSTDPVDPGIIGAGSSLDIGGSAGNTSDTQGWLDDFRITNGVARNTESYTPPIEAHGKGEAPDPVDATVAMPGPLAPPQVTVFQIQDSDALVAIPSVLSAPAAFVRPLLSETTFFDPFYADVGILVEFDGDDGDTTARNIKNNAEVYFYGDAVLSSAITRYGNTALSLGGAEGYTLVGPSNSGAGVGDYTTEIWFNPGLIGTEQIIFDFRTVTEEAKVALILKATGSVVMRFDGADRLTSETLLQTGSWYHLALCRNAGTTRLYVNGGPEPGTFVDSTNILSASFSPTIGRRGSAATPQLFATGHFAGLRHTQAARYGTEAFGTPVAQYSTVGTPQALGKALSILGAPTVAVAAEAINQMEEIAEVAFIADVSGDEEIPPEGTGPNDRFSSAVLFDNVQANYVLRLRSSAQATSDASTFMQVATALLDIITTTDRTQVRSFAAVNEHAAAAAALAVVEAVELVEQALAQGLTETYYTALVALAEVAIGADTASPAAAKFLADAGGATDALAAALKLLAQIAEVAEVSASIQDHLTLTVLQSDAAESADETQVVGTYFQTLLETGLVYADLKLADMDFTGWVMNTEGQQPVSSYDNYGFNSFAEIDGEYYGAAETGLYKLTGDTDDGQDIAARIKSLMLDFGTSRMKRVRSAYLGYTASGKLLLKVKAVSGGQLVEHWFEARNVTADAPREQRVNLAMGIKSRYWQYELENVDGADFEIAELEMHPLILQRRV